MIVSVAITERGRALARRLPFDLLDGPLIEAVSSVWGTIDGLVVVGATGIAVRAIAPLLSSKQSDPAVVCVDEFGRHAVALVGGHRGANDLAVDVAALVGAEPVISTATDLVGVPALDAIPGWGADGDVASVTRRWLDGHPPAVAHEPGLERWRPPGMQSLAVRTDAAAEGATVTVTDSARSAAEGEVVLRPPSLVLGVGASRGASVEGLEELASEVLSAAGRHPSAVSAVASADIKADEPAVAALAARLGAPLVTFPASVLAAREVPNPSEVVERAVGTASVAEAAALVGAGPDSELLASKTVSRTGDSTAALARRRRPQGRLDVVGLGPGAPQHRTPAAALAVRHADVVIGYGPYVDQGGDLLSHRQEHVRSPIGSEAERAREALSRAAAGQRVALVCSGDAGVYAMASLVLEMADSPAFAAVEVNVVPGVTAAIAGAAVLGAPLGHDHASVSLSDLLTDWSVIRRRLEAVAEADFVVSLYNPRSARRTSQLVEAVEVLAAHRPPTTPAAILTDIARPGQSVTRTTLSELRPEDVGMLSLVVIGSSRTRWANGRMVTPRGYL